MMQPKAARLDNVVVVAVGHFTHEGQQVRPFDRLALAPDEAERLISTGHAERQRDDRIPHGYDLRRKPGPPEVATLATHPTVTP